MSLRASLKVCKYGLFYFKSDRTTSIVQLNKRVKVISGDKKSNGSKVELNYEGLTLEAEINGVNGMYVFLTQMCMSWLNIYLFADKSNGKKVDKVSASHFGFITFNILQMIPDSSAHSTGDS